MNKKALTWTISDTLWSGVAAAVRAERVKHQQAGGTSKLTKNGTTYTIVAEGLTAEVFIEAIKKVVQPAVDRQAFMTADGLLGGIFGGMF